MSEELPPHLAELLRFVRGEGEFSMLGSGMHTYPGRSEQEQQKFDGCVELEQRGLVRRRIDEPGYVLFAPVEE